MMKWQLFTLLGNSLMSHLYASTAAPSQTFLHSRAILSWDSLLHLGISAVKRLPSLGPSHTYMSLTLLSDNNQSSVREYAHCSHRKVPLLYDFVIRKVIVTCVSAINV